MPYRIPLAYNTLGDAEISAAHEVLASGFLTQGRRVAAFERELAEMHGVRHAILVNSGSSANLVGIEALVQLSRLRPDLVASGRAVAPGDEVVIQGLNWPSTLKPLTNLGLTPVFCDVDPHTLNASVETVRAACTERTRLVIAVPVLGNPSHLEDLADFCAERGVLLFEDACETIGAVTERGRPVGTIGSASAFSFYFSHHLTTIEGGAILTDSDELADVAYALRAHGWSRNLKLEGFLDFDSAAIDPRFCFVLPGYNVRSTELNAAIGSVQLARLGEMIEARRKVAAGRIAAIAGGDARIPGDDIVDRHSWMTTPLLFPSRERRLAAQASLEADGVETRPIIVGNLLRHPVSRMLGLASHQAELPHCDAVFDNGLMIGLNPVPSDEDEAYVCEALARAARA
ncbi:DegT/DnrJ/EryC1/StrS aminotransferase family protein [Croceicoccus sp. BE223]|uniref:DegT/DnrJ/EryC1/StrS family aminotransferase n=1 Tax=Croceicoccus sp. BE223 TaxID=2817716 RepID=UPI00285763EC|nr:DegT/DnrJ/EryC1/StrS aminotransferase family protein [Croceicoccus sp. BE223]MDR7102058.1 CDP-6-deoxy-D-xylo-4-hexulose-3-dehydrase [Croceicoccus sp. BE223]